MLVQKRQPFLSQSPPLRLHWMLFISNHFLIWQRHIMWTCRGKPAEQQTPPILILKAAGLISSNREVALTHMSMSVVASSSSCVRTDLFVASQTTIWYHQFLFPLTQGNRGKYCKKLFSKMNEQFRIANVQTKYARVHSKLHSSFTSFPTFPRISLTVVYSNRLILHMQLGVGNTKKNPESTIKGKFYLRCI